MNYHVELTKEALKNLKKLDKPTGAMLLGWLRKNLENCSNPRLHGKALVGNHANKWRYRVGDYRLLANIQDDKILILIVQIGHRREIYK